MAAAIGSKSKKETTTGKVERLPFDPASFIEPRGAVFSDCGKYRYLLWRTWQPSFSPVNFLLCNPSTADADNNDPTVERCERRARAMGYGGLIVTNIFAYRATDPKELRSVEDPVGEFNDQAILLAARYSGHVIGGWGDIVPRRLLIPRVEKISEVMAHRLIHCLGTTMKGMPGHPLYIPYNSEKTAGIWEPHRDRFRRSSRAILNPDRATQEKP